MELFLLGPEALNVLALPAFFHTNHRIWFRVEFHFLFSFFFNMLKASEGNAGVKRSFTNPQQTRREWIRGCQLFPHSSSSKVENVFRLVSSPFLTCIQRGDGVSQHHTWCAVGWRSAEIRLFRGGRALCESTDTFTTVQRRTPGEQRR